MSRRSERKRKRVPGPRSLNHTVLGRAKNTTLMDANEMQTLDMAGGAEEKWPDVWRMWTRHS